MICVRCHRSVKENAKFCPFCGARIIHQRMMQPSTATSMPTQQFHPQPYRAQSYQQVSTNTTPMQQQTSPTQQHRYGQMEQMQQPQRVDVRPKNYTLTIVKSYVERKVHDNTFDKADLQEYEEMKEKLDKLRNSTIPVPEEEIKLLEAQFDILKVKILEGVMPKDMWTEELNAKRRVVNQLLEDIEKLESVPQDAEGLENELEILEIEIDGIYQGVRDLRLLPTQEEVYDLNTKSLRKFKRILHQALTHINALGDRVEEIADVLGYPREGRGVNEFYRLRNYMQNVHLLEKVNRAEFEREVEEFIRNFDGFVVFVRKLKDEGAYVDVKKIQREKLLKTEVGEVVARYGEMLETALKAYSEKEEAKMVSQQKEKKENETATTPLVAEEKETVDDLPPLDPLPPLDELAPLEPLK